MRIQIKETVEKGNYPVEIALYERGKGELGIDYDNISKQIILYDISLSQAKKIQKNILSMIKVLENLAEV
jgi:hypothetical protein